MAIEKGFTKNFRCNATSVSLNVMMFKLCDRGSTGLSKGLYITQCSKKKKKVNLFFFRVSFANKYTCTYMFYYTGPLF